MNDKSPSDIEITMLSDMTVTINKDVVEKLGITLPKDIEGNAKMVTGGVN